MDQLKRCVYCGSEESESDDWLESMSWGEPKIFCGKLCEGLCDMERVQEETAAMAAKGGPEAEAAKEVLRDARIELRKKTQ